MNQIFEIPARANPNVASSPARPRAHRSRRGRLLAVLVALLVLAAAFYGWHTWSAQDGALNTFITAPVQRGDLEDTVTATGTLQPKDFVDVGTQVSGQLKKLHVTLGSVVNAGDLLAEIDSSVYLSKVDADHAQLRNQRAQLTDRQAQLALADLKYTRQKNLARENATTAEALQSAEAALQSARAQVEAIKAQIQQTESTLRGDEANLGYTKIYAPIGGTVVSQAAKQGQTLNANQQAPIVLRIAYLSTMTVQAQVSEADIPKLRIGMDVYFMTLGGNGRRFHGKLRQIPPTPAVVNNVVLYDALFDVPNPDQALMTQMMAQVFFVAASAKDALQVPISALQPPGSPNGARHRAPGGATSSMAGSTTSIDARSRVANGRAIVKVVGGDGTIDERELEVGVMNRVSAQIIAGLEAGEQVVVGTRARVEPATQGRGALVPNTARMGMGGRS